MLMTLGLGMWHWVCGPHQFCLNDDPKLTLIQLVSPNAFQWESSVEAKVVLHTRYDYIPFKL